MASTYTTNSGIELIATGEQSGTWGETTNTNLQIIDRLTSGVGVITLSGTTHTLTTTDGTLSDGQHAVLVFSGSPSGTNTVTISPNNQAKSYLVKNSSGESVVLTQGSGGNVTIPDGESAVVYADGAGSGAAVVNITDRASLGLEIGVDVQPYDAGLQSIAGLTTAADKMVYTTASDTYAVTDLTSFARTLLDDADAATALATLGAVPIAGAVTLTGGFDSDEEALGTITSGTVTPEVDASGKENFKTLTNNGAFTLAPPSTSSATTIRIRVINGASAGAITTTGFDKVNDPDSYATTNAKEYWFYIDHDSARSTLTVSEIV